MEGSEDDFADKDGVTDDYPSVVRAMIRRYSWLAVDEQTLVASIAAGAKPERPGGSAEKVVVRHYTRALYKACGPTQAAEVQERAYTDLSYYLHRIALARYSDRANEIAQRAIELVCKTYSTCKGADTFLAFAAMKLHQANTEFLRATERAQPLDERMAETIADTRAGIDLALEHASQAHALYRALARLPEPMRLAVHLKYLEELGDEQIAERLHTSQDNIRQLRSRGLKRLRKDPLLRRELQDEP